MARVFVGIPTLNRPGYLREAVESVLAQSFRDVSVMVSDDGSTPANLAAIERWLPGIAPDRVSFRRSAAPLKEYGQGRLLFSGCRETYFVILHDDDILDPGYLERAVEVLDADPGLSCFIAGARAMSEDGAVSEEKTREYDRVHGRDRYPPGPVDILGPLLDSGYFPISGTVFRTADLKRSGFVDDDIDGNFPFELNLLLNLGAIGCRGYRDPQRLIRFRFHSSSLRNRLWFDGTILRNVIRLLGRHRFAGRNERRRRKILGFCQRRLGAVLIAEGDRRAGRRLAWEALRTNAFSYKNWLFLPAAWIGAPAVRRIARRHLPQRENSLTQPPRERTVATRDAD